MRLVRRSRRKTAFEAAPKPLPVAGPTTLAEIIGRMFALATIAADEAMQIRIRTGLHGGAFYPDFLPPLDDPPRP